jgi:transcriptional regulatory protein RtcR
MATLAENGVITQRVLDEQIDYFKAKWARGEATDNYDSILLPLLGEAKLAETDVIDRVQLAAVIQVCRKSKSAAEAGRKLYTVNRHEEINYSDRITKYLKGFGLHFSDFMITPDS